MHGLKICLWITAVLCLLSVAGLFLSFSACEAVGKFFGVEELPDAPLIMYAFRTVAATFISIGVFFIILALNPMKYGIMVPFSGLAAVFVGVVCAISGPIIEMPAVWYLSDTLSCLVLGVLILAFWQQAKKTS